MQIVRDPVIERRSELALDLFEAAEEMFRHTLRREFPDADSQEIEHRLRDWYVSTPDMKVAGLRLREGAQ